MLKHAMAVAAQGFPKPYRVVIACRNKNHGMGGLVDRIGDKRHGSCRSNGKESQKSPSNAACYLKAATMRADVRAGASRLPVSLSFDRSEWHALLIGVSRVSALPFPDSLVSISASLFVLFVLPVLCLLQLGPAIIRIFARLSRHQE